MSAQWSILARTTAMLAVAGLGVGLLAGSPVTAGEPRDTGDLGLAGGLIVSSPGGSVGVRARKLQIAAETLSQLTGVGVVDANASLLPGAVVYRLESPVPAQQAMRAAATLELAGTVAWAEPDLLHRILVDPQIPSDPQFRDQWHLWDGGGARDYSISAPLGWNYTTGRSDVVVAVLDTGWTQHPDLENRVLNGYDFISDAGVGNDGNGRDPDAADPGDWVSSSDQYGDFADCDRTDSSWHGTHVNGIIAAERGNGRGVVGVAPDVRILAVRVLGKCGGFTSDIAAAIRWASGESVDGVPDNRTPAQVINMSLGGPGECGNTFREAIRSATSRGTTVVVAAGNEGSPLSQSSPANCPGVISVVATNPSGTRTPWSNYGTAGAPATIAAPGESILSTLNSGRQRPGSPIYERASGTSMAAPVVAGAVALLRSAGVPASTVPQALATLVKPFPRSGSGETCSATSCGAGLLDISKLSLYVRPQPTPDPEPEPPAPTPEPTPGPTPLTVPGIIADVRVRYALKGAVATASISWAHTEGAQRSIYYLVRSKRGHERWVAWTRRVAPSITIAGLPRADMSFLEIRGVNEMGPGMIYQVTLYPRR